MYLDKDAGVGSREWGVGLRRTQGGWLMPVAAFIIVVVGFLAVGMARIGSQTSMAGAQEQISLQTFYAAESGGQYAMSRLFYSVGTPIDVAGVVNACAAVNTQELQPSAPGMLNCSVILTCSSTEGSEGRRDIAITSAATCGSGPVTARRTIELSAFVQ